MTPSLRETGTYLDRILQQTARDLEVRKSRVPVADLQAKMATMPTPANVIPTLQRETVGVIAEFKRASPSRGRFPVDIATEDVAMAYIEGEAAAISCLTDEPFFCGSLADLEFVAGIASTTEPAVPVLRKDFIIDTYQVDEARAYGASMVLLIVAALDDRQLREFREYAESLGMSALVEIHDVEELVRAVGSGATIIGINNRNLRTFDVDLAITERLAPMLPSSTVIIGESGIFTRDHVERLSHSGVDAVLVGESLILQEDRAAAVRHISGVPRVP
jgi:indole-3-glycerol phosphate synthase